MLSGNVPFQPKEYTDRSAYTLMKSIMSGEVSFKGDEWSAVSLSAREFIQGIMDVVNGLRRRTTIDDYYNLILDGNTL